MNDTQQDELLTIKQVAEILKVSIQTLRHWDNSGRLKATRVGKRAGYGERRYRKSDIDKIIATVPGKKDLV